jgi:hypothetical protein
MAAVSCALERYRLQHDAYPGALADLAPEWMSRVPEDPVPHESFHYERDKEGSFRLWSVGWNRVDDGGAVLYDTRRDSRQFVRDQLDWVWPSAGVRTREQP